MKIGIIAALAAEASTFAATDGTFCAEHRYVVTIGGVGPEQAATAAAACLDNGCEVLLSWGLAGGLEPRLPPASLLIATEAIDESGMSWAADAEFNAMLGARLARLGPEKGVVTSVATPVSSVAAKAALHADRSGAVVVDMESATLARMAAAAGARFAAVRCVVDPADFDLPRAALAGMRADGHTAVMATSAALLRHPQELPDLLRLAGWYRAALRQLARAAHELAQ